MERLAQENKNTSQEYNSIYLQRSKRQVDSQDLRRWKRLIKYYRDGKLLDVGCLDSKIIDLVADTRNYTGIDIAQEAIKDMQWRYSYVAKNGERYGNYLVMDLYKMDDNWKERFDYVIMGEVIEHLEKPQEAIKEAMRVLKSKGILAISTPLDEASEPGAVDKERHLWSFSVKDIINLLKPYGKVRTAVLGSEYFPTYKYHFPTLLAWCNKE